MNIIKLDAIESTNDYLKRSKINDIEIVYTYNQTKGKGQRGNQWFSESGKNIAFSIKLFPVNFKVKDQFRINVIFSLLIFNTLKSLKIPDIKIKWPNDIMSGNKKISGILIENNIRGKSINYSIIGIGINVNQLNFKNLPKATSLHIETGVTNSPDLMAEELQQILKLNFELMLENPEKLLNDYNKFLFEKDKRANYLTNNKIMSGRLLNVNMLGEILIRKNDGVNEKFNTDEIKLIY